MSRQQGQDLLVRGTGERTQIICVLGCRPGSAALARRARAAAAVFAAEVRTDTPGSMGSPPLVVACGGQAWRGIVEADELARLLAKDGVPDARILRERSSLDTYENAASSRALLAEHSAAAHAGDVVVVTCSWHLRRAMLLFERAGHRVSRGVPVPPPRAGVLVRIWWGARERVATWKDLLR